MDNYAFCVDWVRAKGSGRAIRVLDFGCGAGEIVNALRDAGIDAYGCDLFTKAGREREKAIRPGYLGTLIRKIEGSAIPFEKESFDFVINNQVLEHVQDLDTVLAEIHKVMKPGGSLLSLFPDRGVVQEPHCGIPFLHWFPKKSRLRYAYALVMRTLGLGFHKKERTRTFWSRHFCDYLDTNTFYRTSTEIDSLFRDHFCNLEHLEGAFFSKRFDSSPLLNLLPKALRVLAVKRHCGQVVTVVKPLSA